MLIQKILAVAVVVVSVVGFGQAARADLLTSYSGDAYVGAGGGPGAGGAWYGEQSYSSNSLSGTVEWEVFLPSTFDSVLGGQGYTAESNELVYAFQIENAGTSVASTFVADVDDGHPFDSVGDFNLPGGTAPGTTPTLVSSSPWNYGYWYFPPSYIPSGGSSVGLAYSSPDSPTDTSFGYLVDNGLNAYANPLPEPSTTPAVIPEPGTLAMLAFAGLLLRLGSGIRPRLASLLGRQR